MDEKELESDAMEGVESASGKVDASSASIPKKVGGTGASGTDSAAASVSGSGSGKAAERDKEGPVS